MTAAARRDLCRVYTHTERCVAYVPTGAGRRGASRLPQGGVKRARYGRDRRASRKEAAEQRTTAGEHVRLGGRRKAADHENLKRERPRDVPPKVVPQRRARNGDDHAAS
ncbi:hypothetical protein HPB50_014326 [Hyalomma asiaticum]|uniref:Uncharacterized protein n=1 Tax=Hyalomma asiaticum TaxID=266040 RepID=A0ACB7SQ42_HYAAI|nr:hypothetical protein HPB50_014326 [Hyalomma asiaticum]